MHNDFPSRLKQCIGDEPVSAFARRCGFSEGLIRAYLLGQKKPGMERCIRIAEAAGVELSWLATGKGERWPRVEERYELESEDGGRRVPILEDAIAAGPGSVIDERRVKEWAVMPSWRLRRGHRYYLLKISGDSMEPILKKGDLVLVNLNRREPERLKGRLVAVYWPEEDAMVKELHEDTAGNYWILRARNPTHKDRIVPKDTPAFQVAAIEAMYVE